MACRHANLSSWMDRYGSMDGWIAFCFFFCRREKGCSRFPLSLVNNLLVHLQRQPFRTTLSRWRGKWIWIFETQYLNWTFKYSLPLTRYYYGVCGLETKQKEFGLCLYAGFFALLPCSFLSGATTLDPQQSPCCVAGEWTMVKRNENRTNENWYDTIRYDTIQPNNLPTRRPYDWSRLSFHRIHSRCHVGNRKTNSKPTQSSIRSQSFSV